MYYVPILLQMMGLPTILTAIVYQVVTNVLDDQKAHMFLIALTCWLAIVGPRRTEQSLPPAKQPSQVVTSKSKYGQKKVKR